MNGDAERFTLKNGLKGKAYPLDQNQRLKTIIVSKWNHLQVGLYDATDSSRAYRYSILEFNLKPHRLYCITHETYLEYLLEKLNQAIAHPSLGDALLSAMRICTWGFIYNKHGYRFDEEAVEQLLAAIVHNTTLEAMACCNVQLGLKP